MKTNILTINDENPSINYQTSSINNECEIIVSLDEITDMFNNVETKNDIFKCNAKPYLSLILNDNTEMPLNKYNGKSNVKFLKFSTDFLNEEKSEIIISTTQSHCIANLPLQWINDGTPISNRQISFISGVLKADGYSHSQKFLNNQIPGIEYPAIQYCSNLQFKQNNIIYQGYLPSIVQMNLLFKYHELVNYVLRSINSNGLSNGYNINFIFDEWQTSTHVDGEFNWKLKNGVAYISSGKYPNYVFPFFKKLFC